MESSKFFKAEKPLGVVAMDIKNDQIVFCLENNDIYEAINGNPVKGPN